MKLIKKSIAVMLMLMASVPCLYAAHGDFGKQPTTWDEFVAAYSNYDSPEFFASKKKKSRIVQEKNMIIIDLHYLNDADKAELYADLGKIGPPKDSTIKFIYTHGPSDKQPTTLEEFIAAYNKFLGIHRDFEGERIHLKKGVIEINLHGLSRSEVKDLQNDLLFLHEKGNLRNENVTFNKVVFITGQSNVERSKAGRKLSALQDATSHVYRFYKKDFVKENEGCIWVDLSEKLANPYMLQVKSLDSVPDSLLDIHGNFRGQPTTLEEFIIAYDTFSIEDCPTIEHRIIKGKNGITVSLRGLNFNNAYGMLKDLRDLHLWRNFKLKATVDWYGFNKKYIVPLSSTIKKYQLFDNESVKFINYKKKPKMQSVSSRPQLLKPKAKTAPSSPGVFSNFSDYTSSLISSPVLNSETKKEKAKAESVPSSPQLFSMRAFKFLEEESTSEDLIDSGDFSDSTSSFLNSETNEEKPKAKSSSMQTKSNTKCVRFKLQPVNTINSKAKTAPSSPEVFSNFDSSKSSLTSSLILSSETNEERSKTQSELSSPQPFINFDFNGTTDQEFALSIPNTSKSSSSHIGSPILSPKTNEEKPKVKSVSIQIQPSAQSAPSSPGLFDNFDFTKIKKQKSTSPLPNPPILSLGNSEEKPKHTITIEKPKTSSTQSRSSLNIQMKSKK